MFLKQKKENKKKFEFKKGVSVIEALVLIFVFSIAALSFYSVFNVAVHYITSSKNKIIAVSLVNERMELLRNLGYDDVGIAGGIPNGIISPNEQVVVGEKTFELTTDIRYVDNPVDGIFEGTIHDSIPNDYKIASVTAYWGSEDEEAENKKEKRATLSSIFVPPGVETSVGGGTVSLNAIDFSGSPVPNVSVNIFNDNVSPTVDYTTTTDSNGNLMLQGVPADIDQNYKIVFSKSGYETVITYSPSEVSFIPRHAHMAIFEAFLNERTMRIDMLADLEVKARDPFGDELSGAVISLTGGRQLDDGTSEDATFSYSEEHTTDSSGDVSLNNLVSGIYSVKLIGSTGDDYAIWKVTTGGEIEKMNPEKFNLLPDTIAVAELVLVDKSLDSFLVKIADSASGSPIEGASVNLINTTLGYDVTITTDEFGSAYFPENTTAPLQSGEVYSIEVTADGYENLTHSETVSEFKEVGINLTAN